MKKIFLTLLFIPAFLLSQIDFEKRVDNILWTDSRQKILSKMKNKTGVTMERGMPYKTVLGTCYVYSGGSILNHGLKDISIYFDKSNRLEQINYTFYCNNDTEKANQIFKELKDLISNVYGQPTEDEENDCLWDYLDKKNRIKFSIEIDCFTELNDDLTLYLYKPAHPHLIKEPKK